MSIDRDDNIERPNEFPLSFKQRELLMKRTSNWSGQWEMCHEGREYDGGFIIAKTPSEYLVAVQASSGTWAGIPMSKRNIDKDLDKAWIRKLKYEDRLDDPDKYQRRKNIVYVAVTTLGLIAGSVLYESGQKKEVFHGITENECGSLGITVNENGLLYSNKFASGEMRGPISITKTNERIHAINSDGQVLTFNLNGDPVWYISEKGAKPMSLRRQAQDPR